MSDENEIREKQEYLRINILEKGYNTEEFMNYLKVLKGEKGLEIQNWSKDDLIKAVYDFKRINIPNKNIDSDEDEKIKNEEKSEKDQNENFGENDEKMSKNENFIADGGENDGGDEENKIFENVNNIEDNQLSARELIHCKVSEKNALSSKKDVKIIISLPKINEGNLFRKSYITYLIQAPALGLEVRRRFSDFIWLRDTLKRIYINCVIPPIIKKNYLTNLKDSLIQKRMRVIEKFLQEIEEHPLLRNSQIFYDFISIKSEKDFNYKKDAYNKIADTNKVEDIKTLNGEINICINREKELLAEKMKNISQNNEELMKKITKEYKVLNSHIQGVIDKIRDINIIWDELYKKSNKNDEGEIILGVYDALAKFMEDWGKNQQSQIDLINIKLREYFRYIKNEYHLVTEYYKVYEDAKNDYKKSYQKLMDTKEKLFTEKKLDDWGLDKEDLENKVLLFREKELSMEKMLPEETIKVKDKKKLYGCYLNSFIEEYEKIVNINGQRHKENVIQFIKEMSNNLITFHLSQNGIIGYLDTLKEDSFL